MANLRVVAPGETARTRKPPKSIVDALDGSSRDVMVAMRRALAKKLDDGEVSSNSVAATCKELRELDRLIRELDAVAAEKAAEDESVADQDFDASAI